MLNMQVVRSSMNDTEAEILCQKRVRVPRIVLNESPYRSSSQGTLKGVASWDDDNRR